MGRDYMQIVYWARLWLESLFISVTKFGPEAPIFTERRPFGTHYKWATTELLPEPTGKHILFTHKCFKWNFGIAFKDKIRGDCILFWKAGRAASVQNLFSHHKQVHTSAYKQKCVQAANQIKTFEILKLIAR